MWMSTITCVWLLVKITLFFVLYFQQSQQCLLHNNKFSFATSFINFWYTIIQRYLRKASIYICNNIVKVFFVKYFTNL